MAFSFGTPKPTTGSVFGTPATSAPTFGAFGAASGTNTGVSTPSTQFSFGGFGSAAKPTTTASGFGTGSLFGNTGNATTGFGTATTGLGTSAFGTTGTGFGAAGFGNTGTGFGTTGTGFGTTGTGFGTTGTGFGTIGTGLGTAGFGTTGTGFGTTGFGTTGFGGGLTALGQQQNAQQAVLNNQVLMNVALANPQINGDERDGIIAKLNQLQAYWGTGKGYFNQQGEAVDFTPENPYCRFKVVGYSQLPSAGNDDGLVAVVVKKKESDVRQQQQEFVTALHKCFGSKPTVMVCVDGLKPLPEDCTEVVIYVVERAENGTTKIHPATDVYNYLNQNNIKTQLQTIGVTSVTAKSSIPPALLQQYLDNAPAGIDSLLWDQAKKDNPDPEKLLPVPIIGFSELKKRLKFQEQETLQHQKRLGIICDEIAELQRNHSTTMAKLAQFKRKHLELSHRVLEVMVKQESLRKAGYSVQADEEQLRVHMESIQVELNAPLQFKARLNELLSQIRLQQSQARERSLGKYVMDPQLEDELKQHLEQQQVGLMHIIGIIKDDIEDLKTIEQGLGESMVVR
ncbi:predicted protein [Nematostella vectensis]|uniref:54 kDa nucleoporin n=1 Tax=Nematostella vectensis TaxID=45351 RepID=A7S346_NEMVE|nr:predicted protein [Nematostella vectensis]|eukprot:XP_001633992.1 predicted protein [Nematostella vectensis]